MTTHVPYKTKTTSPDIRNKLQQPSALEDTVTLGSLRDVELNERALTGLFLSYLNTMGS